MSLFLGIEIGGTKLQLGVGAGDGSPLIALERLTVDADRGAEGIRQQIEAAGRSLRRRYEISRIGIGFGGPVDAAAGRTVTSHQIAGWDDFPLVQWCRDTFQQPAVLGNDCDVAALAEAGYGAGRDRSIVFYVTVGTGIGGGLVINGRLHGPQRPAAAEIGHLRPGLQANHANQTVESLASGPGIAAIARARLTDQSLAPWAAGSWDAADGDAPASATVGEESDRVDLMSRCAGDIEQLTAKTIGEAAADGNALALDVLSQAGRTLGWAIAQTVTLIAPEVVVIGGGVSLIGEKLFFQPVRQAVAQYVFPPLADSYVIEPADFQELAVVQGALMLAAGQSHE